MSRYDEPGQDTPASLHLGGLPSGQALLPAASLSLIAPAPALPLDLGPGVLGRLKPTPSQSSFWGWVCPAPFSSHGRHSGSWDPVSAPCGLHVLSGGGFQALLPCRGRAVLSPGNSLRSASSRCLQYAYDVSPSLRPGAEHLSPWGLPPAC